MTTVSQALAKGSGRRIEVGPALVLALVAPLVGEVLNGATRVSYIFAFAPQIMVWGCGAVLIREVVHRWSGRWPSILALAAGLSILVEFIVLQTSVAPIPWLELASIPIYDRVWGVNWLWFTFMLGYEAVWVVLVPILIVDLMFPGRRNEPWLHRRGLAVAALTFAAGSTGLWFLWTRTVVPDVFQQPVYHPPALTLGLAVLACVLLVPIAYALRNRPLPAEMSARTPPKWLVAAAAAAFGFPWWTLIVLVFVPVPSLPLWLPLTAAALWVTAACIVFGRWSRSTGWSERHRWVLAFAALLVCMLAGFLGSDLWPRIDLIGKIVLNVIAVACMLALGRIIARRTVPA